MAPPKKRGDAQRPGGARTAAPRGPAASGGRQGAPPIKNQRVAVRGAPAEPSGEFGQREYGITRAASLKAVKEAPVAVVRMETVDPERAGQRLDNFLSTRLKGVPKDAVYRALRTGQVRVNGKRCKPETRLEGGDLVRIPPMHLPIAGVQTPPSDALRDTLATRIVYEDKDYLLLDKPSGLAVHGGSGVSLGAIEAMRAIRPDEALELVHRLDRDTSGLLMLAKRHSALRKLQMLIREGQMQKRYFALIAGSPKRDRFEVDAALRKNEARGGERIVEVDEDDGKASLSRFRVVERYALATLVEVELVTGRTHQIRVHAQHAGHPLAGDDKYGDADFNKLMKSHGLKRLFLHAHSLAFAWGESADARAYSAPLSAELKAVLDTLAR